MARLVIGLTCFGIGIVASATAAHAQESPDDEVLSAAHDANVDPTNLLGATLSTREACGCDISPRDYLIRVGELPAPYTPPSTPAGWPIGGALGQRIYCIEAIESHHGVAMYNRTPVWNGEHAQGWLGFLPSTARSVGVIVGDRASEWNGAARMLAIGRGAEFAGVAMRIC